ncbi:MAG: DnaD domain protein [Bacillota bacterium]
MSGQNTRPIRKYREGNITSAFSTDLLLQGMTCVPSMLLRYYKRMGLTDTEMMLLVHIIRLHSEEKNYTPSAEELGQLMAGGKEQIERDLASLSEKGMLGVTEYYLTEHKPVVLGFDLEPLYEKLSELWARKKVRELEELKAVLESNGAGEDRDFGRLCGEFAEEFGRPLSPIEAEQIEHWLGQFNADIIREALRRAVLMGKHNFKYIDRILLEWGKNNLRTVEEVVRYEDGFQKRKQKKATAARTEPRSKELAVLKSLYF